MVIWQSENVRSVRDTTGLRDASASKKIWSNWVSVLSTLINQRIIATVVLKCQWGIEIYEDDIDNQTLIIRGRYCDEHAHQICDSGQESRTVWIVLGFLSNWLYGGSPLQGTDDDDPHDDYDDDDGDDDEVVDNGDDNDDK